MTNRYPYDTPQLRRCDAYTGPMETMDEAEAAYMYREAQRYFGYAWPAPPTGLPGRTVHEVNPDVMRLIELSHEYSFAAADQRPRVMINLYYDIQKMLQDAYWRGRKEIVDEIDRRCRTEAEAAAALLPANYGIVPDDRQVYFIGSDGGDIKIGVATDPVKRLKSLQTGSPQPLKVLALTQGGQPTERAYHNQFAAHRLHGEWFERCPAIEDEIARLQPDGSSHLTDGGMHG